MNPDRLKQVLTVINTLHVYDQKIGGHDDLLRIGFDSLKLVRLVVELEKIGISCKVTDFYQYPVVRDFVEYVEGAGGVKYADGSRRGAKFCASTALFSADIDSLIFQDKQYVAGILSQPIEQTFPLVNRNVSVRYEYVYFIESVVVKNRSQIELESIVRDLLKVQGGLRSCLSSSGEQCIQRKFPDDLKIPYLDLSVYSEAEIDFFFRKVVPLFSAKRYKQHGLVSRFFIFRVSDADHIIVFLLDSTIGDGLNDAFIRDVINSRNMTGGSKSYGEYCKALGRTAKNRHAEEVMKKLRLTGFNQLAMQPDQGIPVTFTASLGDVSFEKDLWRISFELFWHCFSEYFKEDYCPVWVKYDAVTLAGEIYNRTIGQFAGFVPIMLKGIPDFSVLIKEIQERKVWLSEQGINLNVLQNRYPEDWTLYRELGYKLLTEDQKLPGFKFVYEMPVNDNMGVKIHYSDMDELRVEEDWYCYCGISGEQYFFTMTLPTSVPEQVRHFIAKCFEDLIQV